MALQPRPPIVTIMGHVDHGKTSLLDYIRKTHIVDRESGGITQHIGAYQAEFRGKKITFIDTPGHAAFNKMRARGARVTDIVILVVAANDGVKPQTIESIRHIKEANATVVVAINKIDLPNVYPDMAKAQLAENGILVQGYGGEVDVVELSAKTGQGVDQLLELIITMAELNNYQADPQANLRAVVIEATKDPKRGPLATVIVQQGTLRIRQDIETDETGGTLGSVGRIESQSANKTEGRVKQLLDESRHQFTEILPGGPAEIIGFSAVPAVGAVVHEKGKDGNEAGAEVAGATVAEANGHQSKNLSGNQISDNSPDLGTSDGYGQSDIDMLFDTKPKLKLIVKADVQGTLEAIEQNMDEESTELLRSSVGEVTEDDLLFADTTGAMILVFHTKVPRQIEEKAKELKVKIKKYDVIYKLLEDLQKQMLKLMEPTIDEVIQGEAEILQVFDIRGEKIAGCRMITGEMKKTDRFHLKRGEEILSDPEVKSLMHGKEQIDSVKAKNEFGMTFKQKKVEFQVGDHIIAYRVEED